MLCMAMFACRSLDKIETLFHMQTSVNICANLLHVLHVNLSASKKWTPYGGELAIA